jgi:Zn-dependent protease
MPEIDPIKFLITLALVLPSLTVHEFAHAWTAYKFGDNTAKSMGRLTLNPIAHIDLLGTIILPLIIKFGYAKPVPVNFSILNRRQIFFVSLAGPFSNLLLAFILAAVYHILNILPLPKMPVVYYYILLGVLLNITFAVFNMIPIPPLDGSRLIYAALKSPKAIRIYTYFSEFGIIILFVLILLSNRGNVDIFDKIIYPVTGFFFKLLHLS